MGADMAYIGTSFIVTRESMANDKYRDMLLDANADDIILTAEIKGIPANMLRQSTESAGLKTGKKHEGGFSSLRAGEMMKAWRDIWSAGPGVGGVGAVEGVGEMGSRLQG